MQVKPKKTFIALTASRKRDKFRTSHAARIDIVFAR